MEKPDNHNEDKLSFGDLTQMGLIAAGVWSIFTGIDKLLSDNKSKKNIDAAHQCYLNGRQFLHNDRIKAFEWFQKSLQHVPNYPKSLNGIGWIYLKSGQYLEQAVQLLSTAINLEQNPTYKFKYYLNLALVYHDLENYHSAIHTHLQALKLVNIVTDRESRGIAVMHYEELAHNYFIHSEEYEKAIIYLKKALDINPTKIDLYGDIVGCHYELKQYEDAILVLESMQSKLQFVEEEEREDYECEIFCGIGRLNILLGFYNKAVEFVKKGLSINNSLPEAYLLFAAISGKQKDYEGIRKNIEKLVTLSIPKAQKEQYIENLVEYEELFEKKDNNRKIMLDVLSQYGKITDEIYQIEIQQINSVVIQPNVNIELIKEMLEKAELSEAIDELLKECKRLDDDSIYEEAMLLSSRYNRCNKEHQLNLITKDKFDVECANVTKAVLQFVQRL